MDDRLDADARARGPRRRVLLLLLLGSAAAGGVATAVARAGASTQPIAFNHKRHTEAKVECLTCHEQVEDHAVAALPLVGVCMGCHKAPQGKSPEEAKVREYAARGAEIPWVQVNRLPGHVYFSHAAHVTLGHLPCAGCHGDMSKVAEPVTQPNVHLSMGACMACHEKSGARNDCTTCHK